MMQTWVITSGVLFIQMFMQKLCVGEECVIQGWREREEETAW